MVISQESVARWPRAPRCGWFDAALQTPRLAELKRSIPVSILKPPQTFYNRIMAITIRRVERTFKCERCGSVRMTFQKTTQIFDSGSSETELEIIDPGTCEVQSQAKDPSHGDFAELISRPIYKMLA